MRNEMIYASQAAIPISLLHLLDLLADDQKGIQVAQ